MVTLLLACAAPAPAPDAAAPAAPAPHALQVALNWYPEPEFGGYYDAAVRGLYRDAGLDVTLVPGGPGVPVLEMLAGGRADVAISGADDLLVRRALGFDGVAVFAGFQDAPTGLLVHADGPKRYEDVTGAVAAEAGSPFQQFIWAKYGWEGKVTLLPTTGTIAPFVADPKFVQQAYVTSEPCLAEAQGVAVGFLPARDAGWNPYSSLAVVRGADKSAEWTAKFVAASQAGWEHYLSDPSAANAEIVKLNPEMGGGKIDCVVARQAPYVRGTAGVGHVEAARFAELAAALTSVGQKASADGAFVAR
jgi:NitT/TauT family transport system substrate-binding protein